MIALTWALVRSESLKIQRTAALWLAVGAPALIVIVHLTGLFNRDSVPPGGPVAAWRNLLGVGWSFWTLLAPVLISFEAAALANLEHRGKQWKQLFALPIPRWSVYATKILFCGFLLGVSFFVISLGLVGNVLIFTEIRGHHLATAIPWWDVLRTAGKAYVASWLVIAIQSWLSARYVGTASTVGLGFAALVLGIALSSPLEGAFSTLYPWTLPLRTLERHDLNNTMLPALFGCVGGLAVGVLVCWDLARRRESD